MTRTISLDDHGPYVVVSGPPSSAKTTLARALAARLRMPLLAQDTIAQALTATLGGEPGGLADAATAATLAVAHDSGSAVLDGAWTHGARETLRTLPGQIVEVYCHDGHPVDAATPIAGGWPVIEVDTSTEVDVDTVVDRVLHAGDPAPSLPGWVVWRQDDHGNQFEVTRRDSQNVAQAVADAMEATGTRQLFWVTSA